MPETYSKVQILVMSYFVYILYSYTINRYYTGSTADPEERLLRHNAGATPSTKPGRPWKIVYTECLESKTEAIKRELYFKKMKSRIFLENLIQSKNHS